MSRVPIATYRLQFNRDFRFQDACALVPYLRRLGITDLYASPLLTSRRGSPHGYDVTDPLRLNPELGTPEEFNALVEGLRSHGMGLVLDIVPNHMAASPENPWWWDVLMNGPSSPYAKYFDIDWTAPGQGSEPKLILPILGTPYRDTLENQELRLTLGEEGFSLHYWEVKLPLDPKSYQAILAHRTPLHALAGLIEIIERLPPYTSTDTGQVEARQRGLGEINERFRQACTTPGVRAFLEETIRIFNGTKGDPDSFALLDKLLTAQPYRLTFWRTGREEINYRRFFDISELVGVRAEDPQVFEATHALILQLVGEGKVTGLRVDHVDGLYEPTGYLQRLRGRAPDVFLVVEKILAGDEPLPEAWPVAGTTGYDFLNIVGEVLLDPQGVSELEAIYRKATGNPKPFAEVVYESKKQVILELFPGEVRTLRQLLHTAAAQDPSYNTLGPEELVQALGEVTAWLPVYRTYIRGPEVSPRDRAYIEAALNEAEARNLALAAPLAFLRRLLLLDFPRSLTAPQREAWVHTVMRWQQFTGAVTAKGVEDTACYRFHALTSRNEVGGIPGDPLAGSRHSTAATRPDSGNGPTP